MWEGDGAAHLLPPLRFRHARVTTKDGGQMPLTPATARYRRQHSQQVGQRECEVRDAGRAAGRCAATAPRRSARGGRGRWCRFRGHRGRRKPPGRAYRRSAYLLAAYLQESAAFLQESALRLRYQCRVWRVHRQIIVGSSLPCARSSSKVPSDDRCLDVWTTLDINFLGYRESFQRLQRWIHNVLDSPLAWALG